MRVSHVVVWYFSIKSEYESFLSLRNLRRKKSFTRFELTLFYSTVYTIHTFELIVAKIHMMHIIHKIHLIA